MSRPLVCSVCRADISQAGACRDGAYFCPPCDRAGHPTQQTLAFDAPLRVLDTPDVTAVAGGKP